jgi:hypothetical protein
MSRPISLTGATVTIKVNGTDLKDYGVVINEIPNGMPSVRDLSETVPTRNGSIDNSNTWESKEISLTGDIVGDSASSLRDNIDAVKKLFRIREDGEPISIELQNRTGYVWTVRLVSFSITPKASWFAGTKASLTISVKAMTPFMEASTPTETSGRMKIGKIETISYAGNAVAPLDIEIKGLTVTNKLYNVSDATAGWTTVNCAIATDAGSTAFPVIFNTNQLKCTQSGAGVFGAYRDILSLLTGSYYCISVYIRVATGSSSNVRIRLISDVLTLEGSDIADGAYLGRSFLKIKVADLFGATYARFQVESNTANSIFFFDGCTVNEITQAEYLDGTFRPYPHTDGLTETAVPFKRPYFSITGKNLCPAGARDMDNGNWFLGKYNIMHDAYIKKTVLFSVADSSNRRLRTKCFRLDAGQYTINFKYKPVTSGTILFQIIAIGERTAGYMNAGTQLDNIDGFIVNEALSVASTAWQTKTKTFTVGEGVPWVIVGFYDNAGTSWEELRLAEIQVEAGVSATAFEYYWNKIFNWNDTIESNEKLIVDGKYGNCLHINQGTLGVDNGISKFTGEFLEMRPGTNNIIVYDGRVNSTAPESYSSGMADYKITRRDAYL